LIRLACDSAVFVVVNEVEDCFVVGYLRVYAFVLPKFFLIFDLAHAVSFELHNLFGGSEGIVFDDVYLLAGIE